MIHLNRKSDYFGVVECPVPLKPEWLPETGSQVVTTATLVSVGVLDCYRQLQLQRMDDIVGVLAAQTTRTASMLYGWETQRQDEIRSSFWRSAHRYVVENVNLVDRGRELNELAKLLKVIK